jgi:signal recognition particle receptor subunit beta
MPTFAGRRIELKLVYYGPAKCGKTTNLQQIHTLLAPQHRGRLMSMANVKDDRTIFFDLLPIMVPLAKGRSLSTKLYTVPGQVAYNSTRKLVLQNVDGIVFVADSQRTKAEENAQSFANLNQNLTALKMDPKTLPLVVQFNKRDLPDLKPMPELEAAWKSRGVPVTAAAAVRGEGVMETLLAIMRLMFRRLDEKVGRGTLGVTEEVFLGNVLRNFEKTDAEPQPAAGSGGPFGTR